MPWELKVIKVDFGVESWSHLLNSLVVGLALHLIISRPLSLIYAKLPSRAMLKGCTNLFAVSVSFTMS